MSNYVHILFNDFFYVGEKDNIKRGKNYLLKAVFPEIRSQDMSSSSFVPKTKLLIGRTAGLANQRPCFFLEIT